MLQLIQQGALILGTTLGAITDAKTGYIFDWITYPMILIGFVLAIMQQQYNNLFVAGIIFALLFITYKFGKLGGGDVKLFVGIALLNPYNDYLFFASAMLIAAVSAMIFYSIFYTIKYIRIGINFEENSKGIQKATLYGVILLGYFSLLTMMQLITYLSAIIILIPMLVGLLFIAFQKGITKNFFEKKILLKEIEEDEVIAEEGNSEKILKLLAGKKLIGENEKALLLKNKIKSIYVLRGLPPFGPFILVGILVAINQPQLFMFLFA